MNGRKKTALVIGGGGFIGSHLVKRLKDENYFVRVVDLKHPSFSPSPADEFFQENIKLRPLDRFSIRGGFDEVFALAADMGGAGFIFSGDNDSDIFINSMSINMTCVQAAVLTGVKKYFFSSSACVYPEHLQFDPENKGLKERDAYPAQPDSIYGWEKLVSEQMYDAFRRNYNLDVRIARFHNIYGPEGTFEGGREKAPAAICRKVCLAVDGQEIEVWGDGLQTRSFLYIDECIDGVRRIMNDNGMLPILNIGSDEMVSINELTQMVIRLSGKRLTVKNIPADTLGVRGRNSDNAMIADYLDWEPDYPLINGLNKTYSWMNDYIHNKVRDFLHRNSN